MKISAIEVTRHRLPLDPPFHASWDSTPRVKFDATIVRVRTDAGLTGIGSGDLMLGLAGHEHLFIGWDPLRLERHFRVINTLQFHFGRCWPLDLALWDLAGKITGQPVWRLLGGLSDRVRAYASAGTLRDPGQLAEAAERYLAEGFQALKIRFPGSGEAKGWRDGLKAVEAVRARVGDRLELMVDCNQGWRMPGDTNPPWTLKDALPVARALEGLGVYWIEEPLFRADRAGMRALREMVGIRVAGGEMTRELDAFHDLIADRALDVLQPDAALVGGITGLRRIAMAAADHGIAFTPHSWTNGMGVTANAHLACGLVDAPYLEFPHDPPEWGLERRDFMMAEPLRVDRDGWIVLDERPGLGYEPNEALLAATRID